MNILVIDNYDSFTYNLVAYVEEFAQNKVHVLRNDAFALEDVAHFDKILISPGPGLPKNAGLILQVIKEYGASKSILGVCLGLQAIVESYGGELINLQEPFHGVATKAKILHKDALFDDLSSGFEIGRYHSWVAHKKKLPHCLIATLISDDGNIMALKHRHLDVRGLQFHPESVLTKGGKVIIKNWLKS